MRRPPFVRCARPAASYKRKEDAIVLVDYDKCNRLQLLAAFGLPISRARARTKERQCEPSARCLLDRILRPQLP